MRHVPVFELAHVRLRAPDLGKARRFAEAFGLPTVDSCDGGVSFRGTDAGPPCQIVEFGDPPPSKLG